MDIFSQAFGGTFIAVAKVFLIIIAAGVLVRKKVITQEHIKALSTVTVTVLLPCLIFSKVTRNFDPSELRIWWVLPLAAAVMGTVGILLGILAFCRELPAKKNMVALCSMQNAGYLILPVGQALYPGQFDRFATYCFLYILMFSPMLWSVGKYLTTSLDTERLTLTGLITPPFVANVLGLVLVFTHTAGFVPTMVGDSIELLGRGAVPVANFVLGAVLGGITPTLRPYIFDAVKAVGVKLIIMPILTIAVLYLLPLSVEYPLMARFLVLQAAAAPATGLILQVRRYGGDERKVSSIMLASYITCIITMPLWMAVWESL